MSRCVNRVLICSLVTVMLGCGSQPAATPPLNTPPPNTSSGTNSSSSIASSTTTTPSNVAGETDAEKPAATNSKRRTIAPVEITTPERVVKTESKSATEQLNSIREALKPFQVLLGQWNGNSKRGSSDHPEWAYDWVSNPKQPGLRMRSEKGTFIRDGRLTYLPESEQFEFKLTDDKGTEKTLRGTFTEPVRDVAGDEKKLQRTYKLQLTEPEPDGSGEQWRITFNQQENNRYILEVDRKRGSGGFSRVDTVHTQREGTSFAVSDTDYGDKTCIISQGLGTISVSFKGKSYYVCCSGCKAAFEEDPEKWISKWEDKKKSMSK